MIYVQISDKDDAKAFLMLAKSGSPVICMLNNIYGVDDEHLKILRRKRISFKKLQASRIPIPNAALAV